jgi:hypothetical protein
MDYPKNTPNVGLIGGKFADENTTTGQPGSLIPAAWGNAVTDELLSVITAAGLEPSEADVSQLLKSIQAIAASDVRRAVLCATTGPIPLSGGQTVDGVGLYAGDRILVKNQADAAQNGIYVVDYDAWSRAIDANDSAEYSPGHLVIVQSGDTNGGSIWQLGNTAPPVLGTTALAYRQVFGKTGVAAGTYTKVQIDVSGRVLAGSNPTTLQGYGITDALRVKADYVSPQRPILCAPVEGSDGGAIEIREVNEVGGSRSTLDWAPSVRFHWGGRFAKLLSMGSDGALYFGAKKVFAEDTLDLSGKADKATTLGGYGITDAYKKVDVDWLISQAVQNLATKATTLAGYGIGDAYTRPQVDTAIQAAINALVNGAGASLDTLRELATALNNDPNFAATMSNELAKKFNKTGGAVEGAVSVNLQGQAPGNPGVAINNSSTAVGAQAVLTLACGNTLVNLIHSNQDARLYLRNNTGQAQALDAGNVISNGSLVHTVNSFLMPAGAQWVPLGNSGVLPAGGTWAYFSIGFNGNGASLGHAAGLAAGGTVVGYNSNSLGFAWRIQ